MSTDRKIDVPFRTQQFVILAVQAGNFHKAARALGVDPSVIIRSVDRLERDLGAKIFARSRNHFTVTHAGEFFVREIQDAVAHVERACDLTRYYAQIHQGPLQLGYSAYTHSRLIPILERLNLPSAPEPKGIFGFARKPAPPPNPEARILLQSGTTLHLVDSVLRGRLHAAFGVQPMLEEGLRVEPIAREAFCLCVSKNHRLAKQPSVFAKELDGEMLYFLPRSVHPGLYDRTVEYLESTGAKPVLREVMSFTHAAEIVARNFGVALLPRSASGFSHTGVLFKPITDRLLWIETALFLRQDRGEDRMRWLLHTLRSQVRDASFNQ